MIELYDYQQKAVSEVLDEIESSEDNIIVSSSVSSGKTLMMCALAVRSNKKVLISLSISDLIPQFLSTMKMLEFDDYTVIKAGYDNYDESKRIIISMDNTLHARIDSFRQLRVDLLISEETHMRINGNRFKEIKSLVQPTNVIGFTGTPYTTKGTMLHGFKKIVKTVSFNKLISQGKLHPVRYLIPGWTTRLKVKQKFSGEFTAEDLQEQLSADNRKKVIDTCFDIDYFDITQVKSVWFTSNVDSAEAYAEDLRTRGVNAFAYHGKLNKKYREELMYAYKSGEKLRIDKDVHLFNYLEDHVEHIKVDALVAINTLTVGWDSPSTEVEIQCSSTSVLSKKIQLDGRLYRVDPTIKNKFIVDFGQNMQRLGTPLDEYEPMPYNSEIKEIREHVKQLSMPHMEVVCPDDDIIYEISREAYDEKINIIKSDMRPMSKLTIDEKIDKFFVEDNISELVLIYVALFKDLHGDGYQYLKFDKDTGSKVPTQVKPFYRSGTIDWIAEDWVKAFDKYPTMVTKWTKSFKTKARALLREPGNLYSLKFFINFLIEKEIDNLDYNHFYYIHHASECGVIYQYQLPEESFDGELEEVSIDKYKKYIESDNYNYDMSIEVVNNLEDVISSNWEEESDSEFTEGLNDDSNIDIMTANIEDIDDDDIPFGLLIPLPLLGLQQAFEWYTCVSF